MPLNNRSDDISLKCLDLSVCAFLIPAHLR
jgi:hypothetical protein